MSIDSEGMVSFRDLSPEKREEYGLKSKNTRRRNMERRNRVYEVINDVMFTKPCERYRKIIQSVNEHNVYNEESMNNLLALVISVMDKGIMNGDVNVLKVMIDILLNRSIEKKNSANLENFDKLIIAIKEVKADCD